MNTTLSNPDSVSSVNMHAGRALVAADHALNAGRQGHVRVRKALVHPVGNGTVVVQRGEHMADRHQHIVQRRECSGRFPAGRRRKHRADPPPSPMSAPQTVASAPRSRDQFLVSLRNGASSAPGKRRYRGSIGGSARRLAPAP